MRANDIQIGGTHYKKLEPETWDLIAAWGLDYFTGNAVKYISRWQQKGGIADLEKAIHYLQKRVELAKEDERRDPIEAFLMSLTDEEPRPQNYFLCLVLEDEENEESEITGDGVW